MKKSNLVKEAVCGVNVELSTADMWALASLAERVNNYLAMEIWRGGKYQHEKDPEKWAQECGFKNVENANNMYRKLSQSQFTQDIHTLMKFVNKLTTDIPKSNIFDDED